MEKEIAKVITTLAVYYGITVNKEQIALFVDDLKDFPIEQIQQACLIYRRNPKNEFFPRPAKLIGIIEALDGRPSVEEAWALVPKGNSDAAFVNDEMMAAWTAANNFLNDCKDMITARMVFKEVYEKKISEARLKKSKPKWWLTRAYGQGSEGANEAALRDAVTRGLISEPEAKVLIPDMKFAHEPTDPVSLENKAEVQRLIGSTTKGLE